MEPYTGSHHAAHSETTWHTISQKEHRMSEVIILATGLGFPEGPVVCQDGAVVLTGWCFKSGDDLSYSFDPQSVIFVYIHV